jgi:NADH-quinone oxidoreductase subunit J
MLFYTLSMLLLISSFFVISSKNPIHSVLYLILVFVNSALLLFLIEIEFLPLMLILVYVGAITILFLFVVMMLDVKISNENTNSFLSFLFMLLLISTFLGLISSYDSSISIIKKTSFLVDFYESPLYIDWLSFINRKSDLEVLGNILYTYYFLYFLIAGIILLVALVGAIVLTLQTSKRNKKSQVVFKQVLRKKKNSVYLVS